MQSEQLTAFYQDYLEWLGDGAPEGEPFLREYGLCDNLIEFCANECIRDLALRTELTTQFTEAGLDKLYPFNDPQHEYLEECDSASMHLNPKRIKWIEDHVNAI